MNRNLQNLHIIFRNSREEEEKNLTSKSFIGFISRGYKISLLVVSATGIGMGYLLAFPIQDPDVGMIFGALGVIALLMLPTYFSYHCYVDKTALKVVYFILCFKRSKEILWSDIAYKVVKRDAQGNALSISLYSINKKKLISFDTSIVGFGKIVRMSKRIPTLR